MTIIHLGIVRFTPLVTVSPYSWLRDSVAPHVAYRNAGRCSVGRSRPIYTQTPPLHTPLVRTPPPPPTRPTPSARKSRTRYITPYPRPARNRTHHTGPNTAQPRGTLSQTRTKPTALVIAPAPTRADPTRPHFRTRSCRTPTTTRNPLRPNRTTHSRATRTICQRPRGVMRGKPPRGCRPGERAATRCCPIVRCVDFSHLPHFDFDLVHASDRVRSVSLSGWEARTSPAGPIYRGTVLARVKHGITCCRSRSGAVYLIRTLHLSSSSCCYRPLHLLATSHLSWHRARTSLSWSCPLHSRYIVRRLQPVPPRP